MHIFFHFKFEYFSDEVEHVVNYREHLLPKLRSNRKKRLGLQRRGVAGGAREVYLDPGRLEQFALRLPLLEWEVVSGKPYGAWAFWPVSVQSSVTPSPARSAKPMEKPREFPT